MQGKILILAFAGVTVVFSIAVWWFQTRAWYQEIDGLTQITVGDRIVPVREYRSIDATTSPLKLRACMMLDPVTLHGAEIAPAPVPLIGPGWFECFNAGDLTKAIADGTAKSYLAAEGEFDGTERLIAVFPDGRAYMWRQLNKYFQK